MRYLFIIVAFTVVGCNKHNKISDVPSYNSDTFNGEYPSLYVDSRLAEFKGRLDSSGLVVTGSNGPIEVYLYDVNTWFRVAVNRTSGGPYAMCHDGIVQFFNFVGDRPYYIVIKGE